MSSPIARSKKGFLRRLLISLHQKTSHDHRIGVLSAAISHSLIGIPNGVTSILDIGCGDMSLAERVASGSSADLTCIDVYPSPSNIENSQKWSKYHQFDGRKIPFDGKKFDVALLNDVLHHASQDDQKKLLLEGLRVARFVVVKDHFESGILSRTALQGMDFIGNWAYGVSVPKRYFSRRAWEETLSAVHAVEVERIPGLDLYGHSRLLRSITRPSWQYISLVRAADPVVA